MDRKKWVLIVASAFIAWWFLGRKKTQPIVQDDRKVEPVFVPKPGEIPPTTRQPDPSSGTAVLKEKQNRILRQMPTVLAIRPEPLLMKVADFQAEQRDVFRRLSGTMTGSLSAQSGSSTSPEAFSTNSSVRKLGTPSVM